MDERRPCIIVMIQAYFNLFLSALAAAAAAGAAVATTTHEPWPISIAAIAAFATSVTQQLRPSPLPRKEWTEAERKQAMEKAQPPQGDQK